MDYQSLIGDKNLAPRIGVSFDPQGKGNMKIYGNWGRYYDNVFADFVDFAKSDGYQTTVVITDDINNPGTYYQSAPLYVYDYVVDGPLQSPYRDSMTLGFEKTLPWDLAIGLSYTRWSGSHQLRSTITTDLTGLNVVPGATAAVVFDSQGNLWVGSNFTVGWQAQDTLWQGNFAKFDPNGRPLSPITTGFYGGGFAGGTFGNAVDANDNVWLTSYGGMSISKFDKNGKSLAGPDGITFNGQLGLMQGVIVTPNGDVWVLGLSKGQLIHFPKGDPTKGRIICEGRTVEPCKSFVAPFHLGIDQQDRIWVTNAFGGHVTRFPASDPTKVEKFKTGWSGSGLAVDSKGNVWVTNRLGSTARGAFDVVEDILVLKTGGNADESLTRQMWHKYGGPDGGSVTLLRPDGTQYPGSPFTGGGLSGPWAAVVDGNDNVWISNFAMPNSPITQLCGTRVENCPPGFKTGDPIAPPGGYVGGGLQMQTDIAVGPAGDVWAMNNWQDLDSCFGNPDEALSTRCGGQGVTIFFGMAKPVRAPQIGPARPY
jgi:streptogramin lyase